MYDRSFKRRESILVCPDPCVNKGLRMLRNVYEGLSGCQGMLQTEAWHIGMACKWLHGPVCGDGHVSSSMAKNDTFLL